MQSIASLHRLAYQEVAEDHNFVLQYLYQNKLQLVPSPPWAELNLHPPPMTDLNLVDLENYLVGFPVATEHSKFLTRNTDLCYSLIGYNP